MTTACSLDWLLYSHQHDCFFAYKVSVPNSETSRNADLAEYCLGRRGPFLCILQLLYITPWVFSVTQFV